MFRFSVLFAVCFYFMVSNKTESMISIKLIIQPWYLDIRSILSMIYFDIFKNVFNRHTLKNNNKYGDSRINDVKVDFAVYITSK